MSTSARIPANHCAGCNGNLPLHSKDDYFYGSPIQTCPHCGRHYLDKHYHEPAVEGFQEIDTSKKAALKEVWFYVLIAAVITVLNILSFVSGRIRPVLLILLAATAVLLFSSIGKTLKVLTGVRKKELEMQLQASEKRLEKKEYALVLKELGYQVPEKYL